MNVIEQLKYYILQSNNLSEPLSYFFDLVEQEKLAKMHTHRQVKQVYQHLELLAVMDVVKHEITHRLGLTAQATVPVFYEVPEYHFFHGAYLMKELIIPATIIYFSDVKTGLFATVIKQTEIFRFVLMNLSDREKLH